uniref:Uncharacterized protein n=1 Tax=Kalanchoe fedtschenkoi TaxID=63787 RepID=A0A7N0U3G2_KALFE
MQGHQSRRESLAFVPSANNTPQRIQELDNSDLEWPFEKIPGLDNDDLRETAYEIFFTACRSSPGFGGRGGAPNHYSSVSLDGSGAGDGGGFGSPMKGNGVGMAVVSRVKRNLGLKTLKRSSSKRTVPFQSASSPTSSSSSNASHGNGSVSPGLSSTLPPPATRPRRPLTSAELMRQQMRVTEQSDNRLRKTLMRTLVGQMGRRAETIILPLELLRHLKPSEFNSSQEYHMWQKRQLKIVEMGLLIYPSVPLEKSNTFATRLREIIQSSDVKPIDTGRNSEAMRTLCNCVVSLAWRTSNGSSKDISHWADGYPLNAHIYNALLRSIFDIKDETFILDEVDEFLELMKKTWSMLGISKPIHNLCFTWILFQQYIETSQFEPDLLSAAQAMLTEVSNDAKRIDRDVVYMKMLSTVLASIQGWSEKRLLNYHEYFHRGNAGFLDNLLPLALSASKIFDGDVIALRFSEEKGGDSPVVDPTRHRMDHYIRTSIKNAFDKILETNNLKGRTIELGASEALIQLAKETEELAGKEREFFSSVLRKWHSNSGGVAAVTLHSCYGTVLKQYLSNVSTLTGEIVGVLERAGKVEKILVQMIVEDTENCDDGGKSIVKEMVPYEVDSIVVRLLRKWIDEKSRKGRDSINRAKETETWNPKSKMEPFAHSAADLVNSVKDAVDEFFEIPICISEDLLYDFAHVLDRIFQDYITFVSSCGAKQGYIPTLPPLTRCNRGSKFQKLWRKAAGPCSAGLEDYSQNEGQHPPRSSTSRGTQRLYIRLNTLHYLQAHVNSFEKALALSPRIIPSTRCNNKRRLGTTHPFFERSHSSLHAAILHVSEVAAYRLIFLDCAHAFYESLYVGDAANARIRPVLRIIKQNISLLCAILTDKAQPLAVKEVMRASFEAFLMVLLAGGSSRVFSRADQHMIEEDFDHLKRIFCTRGEGLISEDDVQREAETVEGILDLMGQGTEQLVEDFSIVTCEMSGLGSVSAGQRLPMPPTTGRWNRSDPNTILRVLCHRNDRAANHFLKRTFQLAKRR